MDRFAVSLLPAPGAALSLGPYSFLLDRPINKVSNLGPLQEAPYANY